MPEENKEQGESMEGILKSIKNIISGELDKSKSKEIDMNSGPSEEDEILELTTRAGAAAPAASIAPVAEKKEAVATSESTTSRDVLENIDAALGQNKKSEATSSESQAKEKSAPEASEVKMESSAVTEEVKTQESAKKEESQSMASNQKNSGDDSLLTQQNAKTAEESLNKLLKQVPKPSVDSSPHLRTGQTIEDLVVESLKPMMADWLNANLPIIVEKLVEKEIKKILPRE